MQSTQAESIQAGRTGHLQGKTTSSGLGEAASPTATFGRRSVGNVSFASPAATVQPSVEIQSAASSAVAPAIGRATVATATLRTARLDSAARLALTVLGSRPLHHVEFVLPHTPRLRLANALHLDVVPTRAAFLTRTPPRPSSRPLASAFATQPRLPCSTAVTRQAGSRHPAPDAASATAPG